MSQQPLDKRYDLRQRGWSRLPEAELAEWGDTSQTRFALWAFISLVTTAVVTLFAILFKASRIRQTNKRRQRAQRRRYSRDLRRWQNRRESYEKKQRNQLEQALRQERRQAETAVRSQLDEKYDRS